MSQRLAAAGVSISVLLVLGGVIAYSIISARPAKKQSVSVQAPIDNNDAASSLPVTSSSGVPLGGGLDGTSATNANGTTSQSKQSVSPASSSKPTIDPSTFSQYEQYKTSKSVMFGEIQVGTGTTVVSGMTVAINYRGWLTNGTLFDQNLSADKPFSFVIGKGTVVPGFEQGVAGMKVGGERLVIIPPSLGYGSLTNGSIPGDSLLVFDIKVLAASTQ